MKSLTSLFEIRDRITRIGIVCMMGIMVGAGIASGGGYPCTPMVSRGRMSSCLSVDCNGTWVWMCAVGSCYVTPEEGQRGCVPQPGQSCALFGCYTVYGCYSCP